MTWWEAEQIANYLEKLEEALEDWSLTIPQMRDEMSELSRHIKKIQAELPRTWQASERLFLTQLSERAAALQEHIRERLKREKPRDIRHKISY